MTSATTAGSRGNGRREDARLVSGQGRYVGDHKLANLSSAVMVRSPHAHARIRGIDLAAAKAAPGVAAILTAADLTAAGVGELPCGVEHLRPNGERAFQARRPVLARDRVRYAGDAVAFVVAETIEQAREAAELVAVDYEDLPATVGANAARQPGAPAVWSEVPDNVAFVWRKGDFGTIATAIAGAAHVVRLESHVTRVNALSMEPRGAVGDIGPDGRLTLYASHQSPHQLRGSVAAMLKLKPTDIRVVSADVGGSFGMKSGIYPEDVLVLFAARLLQRPVRWVADRVEGFMTDDHGRDVGIDAKLALDEQGRFLALEIDYRIDIGCYLSGRSHGLINNIGGIAGVYRIGHIGARVEGVFTNTQTTAPYRGAGRPEATYTIERLVDLAAAKLGVDPFELRRRNLVPPEAMPYDTGFVFTYDCGEFDENMKAVAKLADYAGFEQRRQASAARGRLRGLGIANPIEVAGGPFVRPAKDTAWLKVAPDGAVTLKLGSVSTGQGHETPLVQLVADRLGVSPDQIVYRSGDTDDLPTGRGNGGSSAMSTGGSTTVGVVEKLIERGKVIAADILEASTADITFGDGTYTIVGTDRSTTLVDVARRAEREHPDGLVETHDWLPANITFPNGCHMCEVEIDPETGTTEIVRYSVVEDIGRVLNAQLAHGQMHGGIAQGAGQALGEQMSYDPDTGQLVTASFMDYVMPRADDFPNLVIETREVPTKANPLGVKGVGEAGTVGSMVATINAVCDALKPLGIAHFEMPASPHRVWEVIQRTRGTS
jgi:aerobic carbon-monoxide dehydrogenase large subunit